MTRSMRTGSTLSTVLLLLALASVPVEGQRAALSLTGGWRWGGSMDAREGRLNAAAAGNVGGELAFRVRRNASVLLHVDWQPSVLRIDGYGSPNQELFDMDIWYFMLGGEQELPGQGRAVPYGTGLLGFAWFNPTGAEAEAASVGSETMFAGVFGLGVRIPFGQSDQVQLRLDGRIHLNFPYGGVGFWCGTGGCSGSFGGYVGPVQGSVSAGLRMALGS